MAPFRRGDTIYALPWLADSTVVGYRADLLDKAGYAKPPQTFEALQEMAAKIHTRETAAFITQDNLHWIWPNWLISYGGTFFANPPDEGLTPRFDTPDAIKTAEMFATLLAKYSLRPAGPSSTAPFATRLCIRERPPTTSMGSAMSSESSTQQRPSLPTAWPSATPRAVPRATFPNSPSTAT